jgi:hypothetical protein
MAAFMCQQKVRVGPVELEHRCVDDDDRTVVVGPRRGGLLGEVGQDVGADIAIRIVHGRELSPELEPDATLTRGPGGLIGARHDKGLSGFLDQSVVWDSQHEGGQPGSQSDSP